VTKQIVSVVAEELEPGNVPEEPVIEAESYRCHEAHLEFDRQVAREKDQQRIIELLEDELFSRALRAMGR
jgi:hypothetical protein